MSVGGFYLSSGNSILFSYDDGMKFISNQVPITPVRAQWSYNNLDYELAGFVLDKVAGTYWANVMKDRFFFSSEASTNPPQYRSREREHRRQVMLNT